MLRFAWWSLRGRWERFVTLCLGLVCISICTTLLAGFVQLSTLTADRQISRAWRTPYDLLVRSPAALSPVERQLQMVDPSAPEQTYGGISLKQAGIIAHIPHVAVVAPEAVVGWLLLHPYVQITFSRPGLYRVTTELVEPAMDGRKDPLYRAPGGWIASTQQPSAVPASTRLQNLFEVLPLSAYKEDAQGTTKLTYVPLNASGTATISAFWPLPTLLAGIDPAAEASLVGLRWQPASMRLANAGGLPLLMDTHPWASLSATVTTEYAPLPAPVTASKDGENGLLSTTSWSAFTRQQFDNRGLLALLASELGSQGPQASALPLQGGGVTRYARVGYGLTQANSANSPQPALNLLGAGTDDGGLLTRLPLLQQATSPWVTFGNGGSFATFDAAKLLGNGSSLSAPLGLYQPEPTRAPLGLFPQRSIASWPPLLFTTVNAACALIGPLCISALRVRVAGLGSFGPRSEALLQQVATDIAERTGLHVDVLAGASGRQVTVQMPADAGSPLTFSAIWVQPHAAITIANGVNGANVLLLVSEVSVAALALIAAALLSTNSRRADSEILSHVGWSHRQILSASVVEAAATAFLAALPALALPLLLAQLGVPAILPATVLCILGAAMILYIIIVALATRAALAGSKKTVGGERRFWHGGPWWWEMSLRQLASRKGSAALVILASGGACGLMSLMLLVYWGLDGLLYSTLLGQQVQVSLSSIHIITVCLTCTSAALATGLTLLLVVRERRREFGILLATGWTGRAVAAEIVRESMFLGFLGGLCGGVMSVLLFLWGYHEWSPLLFAGCMLGAILAGMALCALAALYPALLAARFSPKQVLAKV